MCGNHRCITLSGDHRCITLSGVPKEKDETSVLQRFYHKQGFSAMIWITYVRTYVFNIRVRK